MADPSHTPGEGELDSSRAPFLEHLEELRWRLWRAIIGVISAAVVCFMFGDALYDFLTAPLYDVLEKYKEQLGEEPKLISRTVTGAFMFHFKAALLGGVFFGVPIVLYQFWQFVAPGLYSSERKLALPFVFLSTGCFLAGGYFAYALVLPAAFDFLVEYSIKLGPRKLVPEIAIEDYLGITTKLLLAFGVVFEMPVVISFLSWVGVVTHRMLIKFWRWAVVIAFVLGAALTPPDVVSQLFLAVPLAGLYGISIGLAYIITTRRETMANNDDPDDPDGTDDPDGPDGIGGPDGLNGPDGPDVLAVPEREESTSEANREGGAVVSESEPAEERTLILDKQLLGVPTETSDSQNKMPESAQGEHEAEQGTDEAPVTSLDFELTQRGPLPPSRFTIEEFESVDDEDASQSEAVVDETELANDDGAADEATEISDDLSLTVLPRRDGAGLTEEEAFARRQLNLSLDEETQIGSPSKGEPDETD